MKPVIAVNTRLLLKNRLDGIGWFSYHTLRILTRKHPECQFVFLFDRKWDPDFIFSDNIDPIRAAPQARHPFLYYWWFEHSLPPILKKKKADIFLSPDGFSSLRTSVPVLPVIHDLNFLHEPGFLPPLTAWYYNHYFPKFAAGAARIATVSEYSANDISRSYSIPREKIDVVYNGSGGHFRPIDDTAKAAVRRRLAEGHPYFLFVGTLHPRKNLLNQLKAFDIFCETTGQDHRFLVVGEKYYWTRSMQAEFDALRFRDRVVFVGRLENEALGEAYAAAEALMYVSHFEGFGIPIIEAFSSHLPVITAHVTSMPEVAGNAALYADPDNFDSIARAMIALVNDVEKRKEMVEKAISRKNTFTWEKTADLLWNSIEKVLDAQKIS